MINEWGGISGSIDGFKTSVLDYCNNYPQLQICNDVTNLPDVNLNLIEGINLDNFQITDETMEAIEKVKEYIDESDTMLNEFSSNFTTDNIQKINKTIHEIGDDITDQASDIIDSINEFSVEQYYDEELEKFLLDAQEYFDYVYYGVLGFGLFLVAILAFYLIGILLGSCGSIGGPAKRQGILFFKNLPSKLF